MVVDEGIHSSFQATIMLLETFSLSFSHATYFLAGSTGDIILEGSNVVWLDELNGMCVPPIFHKL